jgi:hypothetical protein
MVVGSIQQFADKSAVFRATSGLRRDINLANVRCKGKPATLSQLADHYCQRELASNNRWRTHSTKMGYRGYLRKWIIPRWGGYTPCSIRAGEIELWLRSLPLARSSCAKIRNVMSVLFNHGLRYELLDRNPVQWVRQSAKRKKIPPVLEIDEVKSLLGALDLRERTMVLLDVVTGLRASELFGRWTVLAKDPSTRSGARRKSAGETGDKGMIDSLFCHLALRVSDVIRQLASEFVHALNNFVRIESDVLGHLAPVAGLNVTEAIFATELHGEFRFLNIDLRVGQDARDVVEGREAGPALSSNEQSVILRMCVGTDDQPVECDGIDKSVHILARFTGVGPEQLDNIIDAGTTFILVFLRGQDGESLTDIFLMDTPYSHFGAEAVIALDNDGDLVLKMHDPGIDDGEAQGASQFKGKMLVFGVAVEGRSGRLEDVGRWNPAGRNPPFSILE